MKKFLLATVMIVSLFILVGQAMAESDIVKLGKELYQDQNLSLNSNQSCRTCHHPSSGFADPSNRIDPIGSPVSQGSDPVFFGGRNAPSAAYAGFSPTLDCNFDGPDVICTGGMFWDGRATGLAETDTGGILVNDVETGPTFDPLADQAKGPFQNPIEMALTPDEVISKVLASNYTSLFKTAFGYDVADEVDAGRAHFVYNDIAEAIAAFERSKKLNKFSSKFDQFALEQAAKGIEVSTIALEGTLVVDEIGTPVTSEVFTQEELEGLALFNMPNDNDGALDPGEGGNCAACHPTGSITVPDSQGQTLFTDFSYDNLGVPVNETAYELHYGDSPWLADMGLYATLTGLLGYSDLKAAGTEGLFKVPTLRNVAKTAPYSHNGFFPTLYSIVHFYNKRMVEYLGDPEIGEANEDELGNLGLSKAQEKKIVLFMETLTDL